MLPVGQHTLTTQPDHDDSYKHCILVKLTESSAQAIEDYLRNKDNTNKRPSIVFQKDKGEVCFPIESKGATNANGFQYKKFHIAISSVKESMKQDTSASVECITYANSKLKKLGTIESKVTVQAIKDEVFQATMEKVNNVKEEEKNNSTMEIKHSGAIVNRSGSIASNLNTQNQNRAKQPTAANKSYNFEQPRPKAPVIDRSLRERIIHLLALKPYMKPELTLRLKKDNLTGVESDQLDLIMQSIGVLNNKNQYELTNETMVNEVKEDWPYFSQSDKQLVKRNISKCKQNMANANTSKPSQPAQTALSSSFTTSSQVPNKQFSAPSAFSSIASSSSGFRKISPQKTSTETANSGKITPNFMKQQFAQGSDAFDDKDFTSVKKPESDIRRLKTNDNISNQKMEQPIKRNELHEPNELYDFPKRFKPIQSKQQLKQYQFEFDQSYKEYQHLYIYLGPTAKQFDLFQKELEEIADQSSKEYSDKKNDILKVYNERNADIEFTKKRERYEYLDTKLNYIRDTISQYKKNETANSVSPFSP